MLKIRKSFTALLITAFISYSPVFAKSVTSTYSSKDGYSLKYPEGWTNEEQHSNFDITIFKSPPESDADDFAENVNVVTEKAPDYTTEQYYQANLDQLSKHNTLKNFKLLESGSKLINGKTSRYIIYTHTYSNIPLKVKAFFLANGKNGFVITCTAKSDTFASYLSTFDNMVNSFKL